MGLLSLYPANSLVPFRTGVREPSAFLLLDTQRIVLLTICFLGVTFLIWFLIALLLDEKRMRQRRSGSGKNRILAGPIRIDRVHLSSRATDKRNNGDEKGKSELKGLTVGRSSKVKDLTQSQVTVFRLPGKYTEEHTTKFRWLLIVFLLSATFRLSAQAADSTNQKDHDTKDSQTSDPQSAASQSATPPGPLPTPAITGPLQAAPPIELGGVEGIGKLDLNGIISGMGLWQGHHVAGDDVGHAALSNGQIFIQKTTGWWQFYVQAGAYNILALGTPFLPTDKTLTNLYGPVPVVFAKLVPGKNTSILVGALPTLMGAEYTFDFENMNIERGLLWNQENAVNRGIQLNQTLGKFTASISWNDGYYSNRYSWLSGSLTYVKGPHSVAFAAMGNLGQTPWQSLATPIQNNGSMYALIYTYTKGKWIIQPYYQYGSVPTNPAVAVAHGASTNGGALLLSRAFRRGFSLAGRGEYIASTGSAAQNSVNLMYGPGSSAWSMTVTPTFQYERFFTRGDLSFVRANSITSSAAFGPNGTNRNQPRAVIEVGFLF